MKGYANESRQLTAKPARANLSVIPWLATAWEQRHKQAESRLDDLLTASGLIL
jgi:hypothetical protein